MSCFINVDGGFKGHGNYVEKVPEGATQLELAGGLRIWWEDEAGTYFTTCTPQAELWHKDGRWWVANWAADTDPGRSFKPLTVQPKRSLLDRLLRRPFPPLQARSR